MGKMKIMAGSMWRHRGTGTVFKVRLLRLTDKVTMVHCVGPRRLWNGNQARFLETFEMVD